MDSVSAPAGSDPAPAPDSRPVANYSLERYAPVLAWYAGSSVWCVKCASWMWCADRLAKGRADMMGEPVAPLFADGFGAPEVLECEECGESIRVGGEL